MQLRRLQRELNDYTPVGFSSFTHWNKDFNSKESSSDSPEGATWWSATEKRGEKESMSMTLFRGHAEELASLKSPKGLLLTGPPGAGKTFLINLWFDTLPTPYKARKHYNELVLEIYRAVWEITQQRMSAPSTIAFRSGPSWRSRSLSVFNKFVPGAGSRTKYTDPPTAYVVAKRLILHHWLLVFDEVQLLDVSSANLLADVLSWFWRMGGVVVGTSNKVPEDLYKNGVQRERLEPFVEALKARCPVLDLEPKADVDWRAVRATKDAAEKHNTWFTQGEEALFEEAVHSAIDIATHKPKEAYLPVFGRSVHVPWVCGSVCKFRFSELCNESLGPADYVTIASNFRAVILQDVPVLKMSAKDQARRFISLIDALYEARCRIVILAEDTPENIFFPEASPLDAQQQMLDDIMMIETVAETGDTYRPNVSSYDRPNMKEAPKARVIPLNTLSIFSGKDEQFAFKRALSRLLEMTSNSYHREEEWSPLPLSSRRWEKIRDHRGPITFAQQHGDKPLSEAEDTGELPRDLRPPPKLRDYHVWGVREDWGKRAGRWGKGARVYEKPESNGE
ncbi:hypothetical protein AAF712_000011 [Marasmius tenuissimus]|uniref:Mitochondrial ATPase n=1 Tax=Marasmius tenuissimus TaxID=585030 RepID=A0ABR3AEF1_9AGAR